MSKSRIVAVTAAVVGAILIAAAAVIFAISYFGAKKDVADNKKTVEFIESILPDRNPGVKGERSSYAMPSVGFDGTDYVALIEYPRFSAVLPVEAKWDAKRAISVPCRFDGSVYDGTLVVGGADAEGQFGFVSEADIGDTVKVVTMRGEEFVYTVKKVNHAKNADKDTLESEDYDFSLYAKSRKSGDYIILRCSMN